MRTRNIYIYTIFAAAGAVTFISPLSGQSGGQAPVARYTMDAETTAGLGAANMGSIMSSMMGGGGGNQANHSLILHLGSQRDPTGGTSQGEHFMPQGALLGKSVPLETGQGSSATSSTPIERPKGRLLIFWGCGAHAPKGQPVVIDFAKVASGQFPPNLFSTAIPKDYEVSKSNSRGYGEWPNRKRTKSLQPGSSLLGQHRITSNFTPEINFTLANDFMAPVSVRGAPSADGSVPLNWNSVPNATGYYASVIGMRPDNRGNMGDIIWWVSSSSQQIGGALWDWISPSQVQNLIGRKIVMPPSQTSCTVPAEVKQAGGEMLMGQLHAYGPQADFAYPPRPANARTPWKPEWTTRVRFRSTGSWISGMPGMDEMGSMADNSNGEQGQKQKKKKCGKGLGGLLGGAIGVPGC